MLSAWGFYKNVSLLEIASLGVMYLIVSDLVYLVTHHDYGSLVVDFLIVFVVIYYYSKNKEE